MCNSIQKPIQHSHHRLAMANKDNFRRSVSMHGSCAKKSQILYVQQFFPSLFFAVMSSQFTA